MRFRNLVAVVLGGMLGAACAVKDPLFCNTNADCAALSGRPFCDLTGQYEENNIAHTCVAGPDAGPPDASPDAVVVDGAPVDAAPVCEAGARTCSNGTYTECGPDGQLAVPPLACGPLGCNSTGDACLDIAPSNGLGGELDLAAVAPALASTLSLTIDTTQGIVSDSTGATFPIPTTTVAQGAGFPSIRVLRVKSMSVSSVNVSGTLPLAIVSDGDVTISGTIDVSSMYVANTIIQKPGAGALPSTAACTGAAGSGHGGGGGGGRAATGSAGGNGGATGAGAGGAVNTATMGTPLAGGCTGGVGAGAGAAGGVGGGAIQITSRTSIALTGTAAIDAGGGGGRAPSGAAGGGGGGGSAGMIVLEAPSLSLLSSASVVAARGGAGASSTNQAGTIPGGAGFDGDATSGNGKPLGGTCAGDCAAGGDGGQIRWSTTVIFFDGSSPGAAGTVAGGGGGGATGHAVFKTASGTATISAQVRAAGFLGPIATRNRRR